MMGCAKLLSLQGDRGSASPPTPHLLPDCQFFCLYLGFLLWSVVNPASVSPPPPPTLRPSSCLFLIFSADFPCSLQPLILLFSAALQPFNPTQKPEEKKKSCISTQIYHEWSLYPLSQESMCVFVCVNSVWMRENYPARVRYYLWKWTIVFALLCKYEPLCNLCVFFLGV